MEWTKIPTNILNFDDKDILAIVKYQLVYALAEEEPTEKMLLRYMTPKQLAKARGYNADITRIVCRDITSIKKKRGKDNARYHLSQTIKKRISPSETPNETPTETPSGPLPQIREDKIRENISTSKQKIACASDVKKPKEKTPLQEFSNEVLKNFEKLEAHQIPIWFKRNCRCLSDILKFCGGRKEDIPLALECISICCALMEKKGFMAGYEAVCRNLPYYYEEAKKKLRR